MKNIEYLNIVTEDARRTIWRVEYSAHTIKDSETNALDLASGTYTLIRLNEADNPELVSALCALEPNPGLATLLAGQQPISRSETNEPNGNLHWYEPLEAGSLENLLAVRETLPLAETVSLALTLCEGLAHAHSAGFAHGEITAGNVLISTLGTPKLVDIHHAPGSLSTSALALAQAEDIRSLARLLWLALTGQHPAPTHERIPLPLAAEGTNDNLGSTLEKVLDADSPSLENIIQAFKKFPGAPLNPYLGAPKDVRARMPEPVPSESPPGGEVAQARHPVASVRTASQRQKNKTPTALRRAIISGAGLALVIIFGTVGILYLGAQRDKSTNAPATSAEQSQLTQQDEQRILNDAIAQRNQELQKKGAPELRVRSIERVEQSSKDTIALTAEVESPGYQPSAADLENKNVYLVEGVPVQRVAFELQRAKNDREQWRITKAEPVPVENPGTQG